MDCLDKITLNDDDDEDWTVVNHNKKATVKKEKTLCLPFAEKCLTVTENYQSRRRKGSLCELPLDERLASSLNGSSKEASVELKSKGALKFDLSCERDVAKPVQPKTDVVKGDDDYVMSCVVQYSKSSTQSAHVDFKQEKPKERTFSSSIDDGTRSVTDKTSNSVDATSIAGDKTSCGFVATSHSVSRMSNMDGAMSISENAKMKTGVVTVNSDTKTSITETERSTCKVADGLTSNIEAAVSDITTATSAADTTSTSVRGTMIGEDAVFTRKVTDCAIYGVSGAVIDTNLPVKQSLANLDYLAKQLGFGENWHQNIMKTCSILPVSTVPLPIFDTASCSPTMGQMLSGAKAMDVDKSRSMVGSCMGAASVVPPSTTYLLPGRPDSGTCSGNVKFPSCQNGNNQTSRVSGGTTNSGENTQQSNTDSFERLMLRLREKFPSKTRLVNNVQLNRFLQYLRKVFLSALPTCSGKHL